jgi:hypothetical protein
MLERQCNERVVSYHSTNVSLIQVAEGSSIDDGAILVANLSRLEKPEPQAVGRLPVPSLSYPCELL